MKFDISKKTIGGDCTVEEFLNRFLPGLPYEVQDDILWTYTVFPFGTVLQYARSLKSWRKINSLGLSVCLNCGNGYKEERNGETVHYIGGICPKCKETSTSKEERRRERGDISVNIRNENAVHQPAHLAKTKQEE